MSALKKPVDFKELENELDAALKADELYKLQNDAKIRAIEQKVPTYDHFRNMVLTAHLKPLERSELQKKAEVSWNHGCCASGDRDEDHEGVSTSRLTLPELKETKSDASKSRKKLKNSTDFLNAWKGLEDKEKFPFLVQYKNVLKENIFKVELPADFLCDILKLCQYACSEDTIADMIEILGIFSECSRFDLSLAMIPLAEKLNVKSLFNQLLSSARDTEEMTKVRTLIIKYCIVQGKGEF